MFLTSHVVANASAHVIFLLRWSIVACVYKPNQNTNKVKETVNMDGIDDTVELRTDDREVE